QRVQVFDKRPQRGRNVSSSDSVEQLAAVPHNADAQVLQVLRRQVRQDSVVDLILSECGLVPFEAKTPQPTLDVHEDAALTQPPVCNHLPGETTCLGEGMAAMGHKR